MSDTPKQCQRCRRNLVLYEMRNDIGDVFHLCMDCFIDVDNEITMRRKIIFDQKFFRDS